ncbi:NAD-dependent epimerase/dehydratase family protein [Candidatus Pelagibacter ubique]|nr:NAD-dependent epimerase/dehydratase family protein [Candidatus Pelagibacter ubique]
MKNLIIITGGAGFVGTNLLKYLLKKTQYQIISYDNYSSGSKKNHIKDKRVKYLRAHTKKISEILNKKKKNIIALFHFGEFSRIYQSFLKMDECIESNSIGTNAVFNFCMKNKIKLIYSATSATLGNNGNDKNLSPYAFTKSKNLEMLNNLKKWFNFKFEIIYFYNVYGPHQICHGDMATVIGIFEEHYKKNKPLPIVKPGTQSRRFTHIEDTVKVCYSAWKLNKLRHYSISSKESFSIIDVTKLFKSKTKYLPKRLGERYSSSLANINLSNRVIKIFGKIKLSEYVKNFKKNLKN